MSIFAKISGGIFVKVEGLRPGKHVKNAEELANFALQLNAQTGCNCKTPADWFHAFLSLNDCIRDGKRMVVLLDEISWMAHDDPTFAGTLKPSFGST